MAERTTGPDNYGVWDTWVERFLRQRYHNRERTLNRYIGSWRNIRAYLNFANIDVPRQLTRQHVRDFVDWRQDSQPDAGCYKASKNTALHECKLLGLIMHEAIQSGYATINPCRGLGIHKDSAPLKPRITDDEHAKIMKALEDEPEWMRISYIIAWEQGCRFSETCLPLSDVDLDRGVIYFRVKGHKGERTMFPLSPRLVTMFQQMKADGRKRTFDMPTGIWPSKAFWSFFRKIGLSHICFHSTRVSFVTRCQERGISRENCMRLVGHASETVHAVYGRLSADHETLQQLRALL